MNVGVLDDSIGNNAICSSFIIAVLNNNSELSINQAISCY